MHCDLKWAYGYILKKQNRLEAGINTQAGTRILILEMDILILNYTVFFFNIKVFIINFDLMVTELHNFTHCLCVLLFQINGW